MGLNLNYYEKKALDAKLVAAQKKLVALHDSKKAIIEVEIPKNDETNALNKKIYEFYHFLINEYENERKQLMGEFLATPLVEADLIARASYTGRLYSINEKDLVRIPEFDGGNLSTTSDNELNNYPSYAPIYSILTSGLSTTASYTGTNVGAITSASTQIVVNTNPAALVNKYFIMRSVPSALSFIGFCTGSTFTSPNYTLTFTFVTTLSGTIGTGSTLTGTWTGFTDTERTNKTSTVPNANAYKTVMDYYLTQIDNLVTPQIANVNAQVTALNANGDDNLDPSALVNANNALTTLNNYKTNKGINNAGIAAFNTFITNRTNQINARASAILTAKSVYYDKRYDWAVQRAGARGSMEAYEGLNASVANIDKQISQTETEIEVLKDP